MRKDWLKPALSIHWQYEDLEVDLERWIIKFGSPYGLSLNRATVPPSDSFLIASLGREKVHTTHVPGIGEANPTCATNDNG